MSRIESRKLLGAVLVGTALGASLVSIIAALLKRRRSVVQAIPQHVETHSIPYSQDDAQQTLMGSGDISLSSSMASLKNISRASSTITLTNGRLASCTLQQLCHLGVQHLHKTELVWEEALARALIDTSSQAQVAHLRNLIHKVRQLQTSYQEEFEGDIALDAAMEALQEMDAEFELRTARSLMSDDASVDSFVSAVETPDLSDLEEKLSHSSGRPLLYEAGLLELHHGSVLYRKLRTSVVCCESDSEFLAKLHILRSALDEIMKRDVNRLWFFDVGKKMISAILVNAQRDPTEFITNLDKMNKFIQSEENFEILKAELGTRGVKCFTMYDIVLDWMLMDAFDDLANPPYSVVSVVQNRWLSNGLKETALSTAVWSILKAKRRLLKNPGGFIAHFYTISESVSPVLAWAFLGPDNELKVNCNAFKDQCLGFIRDLFNSKKIRYTVLEEMTVDIMDVARQRAQVILNTLSGEMYGP